MNETAFPPAARRLVTHLRRCCSALADGVCRDSLFSPAHWRARFDIDACWWRYTVLTTGVREDCAALRVELPRTMGSLDDVGQLAALLRALEQRLPEWHAAAALPVREIHVPGKLLATEYHSTPFAALPAAFDSLGQQSLPGLSLFLHGSMADRTFTAFSDVDDLVLLRPPAWQDAETLRRTATALARVARAYQDIDPLQHHGHWVVTEFDLACYDESVMPLAVLDGALLVAGEPRFTCRPLPAPGGFRENVAATVKAMHKRLRLAAEERGLNAFRLKELAGEIAILPAYVFQCRGRMISKPDAIRRAGELFSPDALPALDWATRVRSGFEPLVHNAQTGQLQRRARRWRPRRHDAEALFKRGATWVGADHPLGLNPFVLKASKQFADEAAALANPSPP